jgi:hypothetical protein
MSGHPLPPAVPPEEEDRGTGASKRFRTGSILEMELDLVAKPTWVPGTGRLFDRTAASPGHRITRSVEEICTSQAEATRELA